MTADDLQAYLEAGVPAQGITWQVRVPENATGRFAVLVEANGKKAVRTSVVLGDRYPPGETVATESGAKDEPVKEGAGRVSAAEGKAGVLAAAGVYGWKRALGAWDIGWLWLYVLSYLPILLILRVILQVA